MRLQIRHLTGGLSMWCVGVQEARLLSSLRHPNIVTFMGLCTQPACIITEFCSRGSVTDVIRRGRASPATLPWTRRLDMVRQVQCVWLWGEGLERWCAAWFCCAHGPQVLPHI